jgi:hypothetical protein
MLAAFGGFAEASALVLARGGDPPVRTRLVTASVRFATSCGGSPFRYFLWP